MLKESFITALLAVLAFPSVADVSVPNTPAGHALGVWLDAFNSDDRAREASFIKAHAPWINLDYAMTWRAETGGYDLLDIVASDATNVFFRVKAKTNAVEEIGRMRVSATEPAAIKELQTWRIPAGGQIDVVRLDATASAKVIARANDLLDAFYVFPETAKKMSSDLRRRQSRGQYRTLLYGQDLARKLTEDLRAVSHDKHLEVRFSYVAQPEGLPTRPPEEKARRLAAINCGFEKVEHMPPNIGYLKFNMFADPDVCALTASAALTFLADSDALILDLRDNNGGMGGMNQFIASYLFAEPTHLNDVFDRPENATRQSWTLPYVPGKKFVGKPVFVLTSKRTFSAAEDLCYALKNLQRATLIGETTGGGAHPIDFKRIDDHFLVVVPTGRSISPITNTNWEGTGVEPDINVSASEALETAKKLAAEAIRKDQSHATGSH